MITPIETAWEPDLWRNELRAAIRSSRALLDFVGLPAQGNTELLQPAEEDFPILVPRGFASRMKRGDAGDPLLLQVLANTQESLEVSGFVKDPLEERSEAAVVAPSLIQKYHGRALLITTTGCAVHCRYCFRRHFPYAEHRPNAHTQALQLIREDASLSEVILSGGDPLLLDDASFKQLLDDLACIPHIRRIRIHSRIPVVLPERITSPLLDALGTCAVPTVMVIHANHPQEFNATTARALSALSRRVRFLFNQAVLLKGVNNDVETQVQLSEQLFDQGVQPYYLHLPDRVAGTHHFFIDDQEAHAIHQGMQATLPGYLVPKLVRENPGQPAKSLLFF